jgi:endonuclease/exonuclease/phosphatase family metal-dependent hydrolase
MRIDHMFITPDFTVEGIEVPQDKLTRKASDHLPLIAAVNLRESGEKELRR